MEWDSALVSSKVSGVPSSDQNKTFHQLYQEWESWVNPWLDSNTAPACATIARCSLSYKGTGAGHEHSSENYIFNNIRQHEIHTDATAAWGVSSDCGDGFLCDQEVAKVWNDLNASSKVGQPITVGSKSVTFASDILDFWRGFGSSYYAADGSGKVKVLPPPETGVAAITALTDDFAPIVDAYYAYPSVLMCSTPISLLQYVWNNARPAHSFTTYKNKDKDKHYLNCSKCGKTNIEDYHVHDGALSDTQCDLCGYRQGMPSNWCYTQFASARDPLSTVSNPSCSLGWTKQTSSGIIIHACPSVNGCNFTINENGVYFPGAPASGGPNNCGYFNGIPFARQGAPFLFFINPRPSAYVKAFVKYWWIDRALDEFSFLFNSGSNSCLYSTDDVSFSSAYTYTGVPTWSEDSSVQTESNHHIMVSNSTFNVKANSYCMGWIGKTACNQTYPTNEKARFWDLATYWD